MLNNKRIYESVQKNDGYRILVDRLWPRGMKKADAHIDVWEKNITPSGKLRKAYHQSELTYAEFKEQYEQELDENSESVAFIERMRYHLANGNVTLLTSAKEIKYSHVPILMAYIQRKL